MLCDELRDTLCTVSRDPQGCSRGSQGSHHGVRVHYGSQDGRESAVR